MSEHSTEAISTPGSQSREKVTEAVVSAVSEEADLSPLELEPLADILDPDALNALVECGAAVALKFTYHGFAVSVGGDGRVSVEDRQARR